MAKSSPIVDSAAPSMALRLSSLDISISTWLRFEETPPVRVSTVSAWPICSRRIRVAKASKKAVASEAVNSTSAAGCVPALAGVPG